MLCEPPFQVHVTVLPATIVSTAVFWLPLWALRKKMSPTVTWPTGPPPPPPPPSGEVMPPHAASERRAVVTINVVCRTSQPPSRVNEIPGLAVDQIVHHHQVDRTARADVIDVGVQRTGAERNPDPGDDRVGEGDPNEGEPAFVGPNRRAVAAQAGAVLREQLNRGLVRQIDVAEHDAKAANQRRRRLAGDLEQLVELVAADRREDIGGGEEEELRRVVRVDLAEQGGVVPEPGARRGEHRPRLHGGVEEIRREVVAVIERDGGRAVPVDLAASGRLLAGDPTVDRAQDGSELIHCGADRAGGAVHRRLGWHRTWRGDWIVVAGHRRGQPCQPHPYHRAHVSLPGTQVASHDGKGMDRHWGGASDRWSGGCGIPGSRDVGRRLTSPHPLSPSPSGGGCTLR